MIDGATIGATTASSAKFTVATIDGTGDAEFFIDANANSNDSKLHFYANGSLWVQLSTIIAVQVIQNY